MQKPAEAGSLLCVLPTRLVQLWRLWVLRRFRVFGVLVGTGLCERRRGSRASRDERVVGVALAAKIQITSELAALLATPDRSGDELLAASHGILGFALANVELTLAGQASAQTAWEVTCRFATSQMA